MGDQPPITDLASGRVVQSWQIRARREHDYMERRQWRFASEQASDKLFMCIAEGFLDSIKKPYYDPGAHRRQYLEIRNGEVALVYKDMVGLKTSPLPTAGLRRRDR